jgi:cell division protein FtsQ
MTSSIRTGATRRLGELADSIAGRGDDSGGERRGSLPHRRLLIVTVACVVVGVLIVWLVAFSSVFGVGKVEVTGARQLTIAEVLKVADVQHGAPLIRLDTGAIQHRVEQMPDVASATVSTSFPSTVRIMITERVAVGVVKATGGYRLVDRTGFQYRTVSGRPGSLPLFVLPAGSLARSSGQAVAVVAASLSAPIRAEINSVQALDPTAITLLLHDGRVVAWGSSAQSGLKARVLAALLKRPGQQINVTDPAQPFTR